MNEPVGFMSYVRFDDEHENGRLTEFCKRLSGEVRVQTGEKFHIFQDRNDIAWGQQWKERIDDSLDAVTFLIPIVTPTFLKSPACREEFERFIHREKELGRSDLILPVYYVNCPIVNDEAKWQADPVAKIIASRQYADWRELRFEPLTAPEAGKMMARMAVQIVEALDRQKPAAKQASDSHPVGSRKRRRRPIQTAVTSYAGAATTVTMPRRASSKTEPPTRVVDALHRGDYSTLNDALREAKPGDRILVRPGLYKEAVVIDKPVEIIGDGELGEVVLEATGAPTVSFRASMGRIANLTIRQAGGGGKSYCIDIAQGRLDIEGCDISSQGLSCIGIHGGADPRLRRNRIHDGQSSGVYVYDNGLGTFEDNEIFGNAFSGVEVKGGGNPTLRRNRIHDGKSAGVLVYDNAQGTIEDNEISDNAFSGVQIRAGGNPTLRRNRIHDEKGGGVMVYEDGLGLLEDNEITSNALTGVEVKTGGNPTLRRNRINKNGFEAIYIHDGGLGTFEANDLRGNAAGAWDVSPDCMEKITRAGNIE